MFISANTIQKDLVTKSRECGNKFKACKELEDEAIAHVSRY